MTIKCFKCGETIENNLSCGDDPEWNARYVHFTDALDSDHEAEPMKPFVQPDGNPVYFVAAYEVNREYGGPEEGGWWYNTGTLESDVFVAFTKDDADAIVERLRVNYPFTKNRYRVNGGIDHDYYIDTVPPEPFFPKERPHYE